MRRVTLGTTGIETSCLGFGCASLGSRVGEAPGLRALAAALDAGVTWLDLAPLYGAGRAEEIAGRFLEAPPRRVQLCSKVGPAPGVRGPGGPQGGADAGRPRRRPGGAVAPRRSSAAAAPSRPRPCR